MTVFGRDTVITCLQTLVFGPELARTALEVLAELQAKEDDPTHRRRARQDRARGPSRQGCPRLVRALLRDRRRDAALPDPALRGVAVDRRRCARPRPERAGAARARMDRQVRRPRRRRVRRVRAPRPSAGSTTSRGRTRGIRSASTTARWRSRRSRHARCRVTCTTRSDGIAELAREVWRDRELADRLEREAAELRERFDEAFWVEERGGYYALALDAREAEGRLALLEHRPPALERHRPAGTRRRGRRPADGRRAVVGLGRAHDVDAATPATTRSRTTTARSGRTTIR